MGTRINLRSVRKAAARQRRAEQAAENRVIYGRTKSERKGQSAKSAQAARHLDAHRIDTRDDR